MGSSSLEADRTGLYRDAGPQDRGRGAQGQKGSEALNTCWLRAGRAATTKRGCSSSAAQGCGLLPGGGGRGRVTCGRVPAARLPAAVSLRPCLLSRAPSAVSSSAPHPVAVPLSRVPPAVPLGRAPQPCPPSRVPLSPASCGRAPQPCPLSPASCGAPAEGRGLASTAAAASGERPLCGHGSLP